jgi:hypothetical protein
MPTRRVFELIVVTSLLMRPAFGTLRLWSSKTLRTKQPGTILHGIAEIGVVIL